MGFVKSLLGGSPGSFQAVGPSKAQRNATWENTQNAIKQQQDFVNALNAQNGLQNQSNVFGQMQGLSNQFGDIAAGQGPNPAQAMLAQATGQNVANQAALMAGQRGASANTGLIARQAAQQGGNLQQQAAGQGATMQANQSLQALAQQQQQQAQLANLANTQVGQQQGGLSQLANQGLQQQSNIYGLQSNANNVNAQMAQQKAGMQGNLLGSLAGAAGTALMGPLGGALAGGLSGMFSGGGSGGGAGSGMSNTAQMSVMAQGGEVSGPKSAYGKHLHGIQMAQGGKVPALVSPGEVYLKPQDVKKVAQGKKSAMDGEKIPGKAKVAGAKNDYANDTVSKTLDAGGIVVPRSVTQAKDSERKAIEFVQAILAKHHKSLPKK